MIEISTLDNQQNHLEFIDHIEFWVSNSKSFIKSYLEPLTFNVIGYNNNTINNRVQYLLLTSGGGGGGNNNNNNNSNNNTIEIINNSYLPVGEYQFIIVTSSTSSEDEEFHSKHRVHGDFIQNIAFYSSDVKSAYWKSIELDKSISVQSPISKSYNNGLSMVEHAIIKSPFKDLVHTFISRNINNHDNNPLSLYPDFLPVSQLFNSFYIPPPPPSSSSSSSSSSNNNDDKQDFGVKSLDHIACCVNPDEVPIYTKWYYDRLGFKLLHDEDSNNGKEIDDENEFVLNQNYYVIDRSDFKFIKPNQNIGLKMAVLSNQASNFKTAKVPPILFVIVEGIKDGRGQVEQFLKYNNGSGVQHLAFNSKNIFKSVEYALNSKLEFVRVPDSYYDALENRNELKEIYPSFSLDFTENLKKFKILIDADNATSKTNNNCGFIQQIFTKYLSDKPTIFFELIQRSSALGFGKGNIIALFESIERENEIMNKNCV